MTVRRKLYYIPGVISLTGYIFLLPYAYNKSRPTPVTAIGFNVPRPPSPPDQVTPQYTTDGILADTRKKKKIRFQLDGDHDMNQKKVDVIRFEARKLKYTLDSTSVIFIELSQQIYYGELVRLYDNCIADKIQRFATWDNYFIIFGGYIPRPKATTDISYFLCADVIALPVSPKKSILEKLIVAIKPFSLKQITALIFLWLLMGAVSFYNSRERSGLLLVQHAPEV